MNCLRGKSMKEIKDATVSAKGIILNTVSQVLGNNKVTTFGELYSPIVMGFDLFSKCPRAFSAIWIHAPYYYARLADIEIELI